MSTRRHLQREKGNGSRHSFGFLTRTGPILVLVVLILGCRRAKPPRTVTVPEMLEPEQEITAEGDSSQPSASLSAAEPTPSTILSLPTPTTTVDVPTIGPTPPSPQSPPHPSGNIVHVVKTGETLYSIAKRYDTTVLAIMDKNDLSYSNAIHVNQELVIPVGHKPSGTPTPYTVEHIVRQGESLAQLARTYRTTLSDIMAENPHIGDPNDLSPGIKLSITVGTAPPVRVHVVAPGQSVYTIARRYGMSVDTLVRANGLRNPNAIDVGQRLVIPY